MLTPFETRFFLGSERGQRLRERFFDGVFTEEWERQLGRQFPRKGRLA